MPAQQTALRVRSLIEDTSDAYSTFSSVNADYAAFASLSLYDFKRLLQSPSLTGRKLRKMIRHASVEHRDSSPDSCWSTYLSKYITAKSND